MTVALHPLTRSQTEALQSYLAKSKPSNYVLAYELPDDIDLARLTSAVNTVLNELSVFRRGVVQTHESWQYVDDDASAAPTVLEYSLDDSDVDEFAALVDSLAQQRFRPTDSHLVRVSLIHGSPNVIIFTAAPFLLDRQSVVQIAHATSQVYNEGHLNGFDTLPQTALIDEESAYWSSDQFQLDRGFWKALTDDHAFEWKPPQASSLEVEFPTQHVIDAATMQRFSQLCADIGVSVDSGLLATAHFLLHRITGNTRIQTGIQTQRAGRVRRELGCDETTYLRVCDIDPSWTVREYFRKSERLLAYERFHGRYPISELAEQVRKSQPTFPGFSNVLVNGSLGTLGALTLDERPAKLLRHISNSAADHDMLMAYSFIDEGLRVTAVTENRADAPAVLAVLHRFVTLLTHNLKDPDQQLETLQLFDPATRQERIDESWGEPLGDVVPALTRILRHAREREHEIAIECEESRITFAQLLEQSGTIASALQPIIAGRDEPLVGICMTRGIGMIVALLGVMRAGAGYVPLDPANPIERLQYILADSGAASLITDEATIAVATEAAGEIPTMVFEATITDPVEFADKEINPHSIAYVIYTSGTTGKPKGVVIEHHNLDTFAASMSKVLLTEPGDRWLQFASLNFDASVMEIASCLTNGATMIVTPSQVRSDPLAVHGYIEEHRITHAFIPPAMLKLLPLEPIPTLRHIVVGGEATDAEAAAFWSQVATLWNGYGPTETTVACSSQPLKSRKTSDLGRPLPGYAMYLLDESGEPAAVGGIGEIWIAGDAVTRGYLNRPDLTESKFITDPFRGGRMYSTGDLARRLPDRGLEFIGRNDFQVKIRGYRMEIGDIESVISDVAGVGVCIVMPVDVAGDKQLAAWYTSPSTTPDQVRAEIERVLPYYMVPSHLVRLDSFPVNIAGKIDRAQLELPVLGESGTNELSGLALTVAQVWAEALGVDVSAITSHTHFFHSGGHSLSASVVCSRLSSMLGHQIPPRLLFEAPQLLAFIDALSGADTAPPLPELTHDDNRVQAPFNDAIVRSIWTRAIQNGSDNAYTIFLRVEFAGLMNPQLLRMALLETLKENPVFRSRVIESAGSIVLEYDASAPIAVRLADTTPAELDEIIDRMRTTAFDVTVAPLWESEVVIVEDRIELLFAINHIIFDGWSLNLFLEELHARYEGLLKDVPFDLERLTAFDYGVWSAENLSGERWANSTAYWAAKMANVQARTALPTASAVIRPESNRWIDVAIDATAVQHLRSVADRLDVTLSPTMFAVVLVWLWRISNQASLSVAYPYAGRDVPGADAIYGMFVKMGFLHAELDPNASFASLVNSVAKQMIEDREHFTATPYDIDLAASGVPNVIFSLQSGVSLEGEIDGHAYRAREYPSSTSKAELTAIFYEVESGALEGRMEFDSAVLDESIVRDFSRMLATICESAGRGADVAIEDLAYLDASDSTRLQQLSVGAELQMPDSTIVEVFAEQVRRVPNNVALMFNDERWTYAQLNEASNALAHRLVSEFGVSSDRCVGISIVKSPMLIVGVLAILKAGGAYVALDTSYPADRLAYIIEDSGSNLIVADDVGRDVIAGLGLPGITCVDPTEVSESADGALSGPTPYSLAYVIYTSGSTGKPKGVMIEHRSVPRLIAATRELLDFDDTSRMVLMGTINFDASVVQMFLPLLSGGTLVVLPPNLERDPELLHDHLCQQGVSHALVTPSLIRNLPQRPIPSMRSLCFGGEEIDAESAAYWSSVTRLFSLYGPTETTVLCTGGQVLPGHNHRILGRPVPGYRVYLLNSQLQQTPVGCVGEVFIGGSGDARGYLGKPELSLERFMVDPFANSPYSMMYRSGDLGRFDADGNIEFFGRNDSQIKLRGFRIELGEIEKAIQNVDGVIDSAADVRGEGQTRAIVGYYTSTDVIADDELVNAVSTMLPEYMIPTFWINVQAIPRTANGKLDRKALPDPKRSGSSDDPPLPGLETQIAEVMERLLNFSGVGREDDFFKLGGNSLLVARFQASLKDELGLEVSIAQIYAAPTVVGIAAAGDESAITNAQRTVLAGLPFSMGPSVGEYPERISHALLTGAKGFLGVYLLAELLERVDRVTCLLRDVDVETAKKSLENAAERASLELAMDRIEIALGDLGSPRLGVDEVTWSALTNDVDAIVHCGAWVHHLYSYSTLKTTNVDATVQLLELASTQRRKYFTFVSTIGTGEALEGVDRVTERVENAADHPPLVDNGYILGKWVSEELVQEAHDDLGLAAIIARPGNITGDVRTGYSNYEHNHFWLFVKGCLQLGACPAIPTTVEMTPVDQLAKQIATAAIDRETGIRVLNLSNPQHMLMSEFIVNAGAVLDIEIVVEEPAVWQARLADLDPDNGLFAIRDFYTGDISHPGVPVDTNETTRLLAELGVATNTDYSTLTELYARYLRSVGFLP